jgi:F-type H+-transporting ATPase subunit a
MAEAAPNPLDPNELFSHVKDADSFHLPHALGGHVHIPQPFHLEKPIWEPHTGNPAIDSVLATFVEPLDLKLTKFMVLEVVAAIILCVVFIGIAQHITKNDRAKGRWWNLVEAFLLYFRDNVARPAIGKHDGDRFLPFIWTLFFFVLVCNLLGMVPWAGSPTGSIATTGALALATFVTVIGSGMAKLGVVGFWKAQVPHMDMHIGLAVLLVPMIFAIEMLGLVIKHFVLAVRLLANMMAGHLVLAVLVAFIGVSSSSTILWLGVTPVTVLGASALSLLELFVAFLQAYLFAFLSALFIGMAVHPH